jgi:RND family efflux transporter MFP subunit
MESFSTLYELTSVLLACRDAETLLKTFAARASAAIGARAVQIWLVDPSSGLLITRARWTEAPERFSASTEGLSEGLVAEAFESATSQTLTAKQIPSARLSHLDETFRARLRSALYVPIEGAQGPIGVIEVLNKHTGDFTPQDAALLGEAGSLAAQALANLQASDEERQSQFSTLERLTALYDLGRTFTSTLELGELLPIVAGKVRDILGAGACNLWLADPTSNELYLAHQSGEDPTVEENQRVSLKEGLLGDIAQLANPRLIESPAEEPALAERLATGKLEIQSWMGSPLRKNDEVLGVVEIVNRVDGTFFDEDDLFFLSSVSEQAAVALHNANLLESERRVNVLDALLKISQEITSTLDLDHVLSTVVQQSASVIPFDKCVIGFFDRNHFTLGAVSGESEVPKTNEMAELRRRLEWVSLQQAPVCADLYEDGWRVDPDDSRARLVPFLEANGYNGCYALALRDDQGTLGVMALLSGDADFLTASNKETLAILASQTTVAIRNAQLYQQVPLANLLQPLAKRRAKLLSNLAGSRWVEYAQKVGLAILFLVVVPWPMRIGTDATVVPAERRIVSTMTGAVVDRVAVHEGDLVQQGQVLARLDDSESRVKLAQAQADLAQARRDQAEAEFRNDPAMAGQAKIRADLHTAEYLFEQRRSDLLELRAPISGVVVTPKVEEKAGTMLHPGDPFCEIVNHDKMAAEMSVPEKDLALVRTGKNVFLKLNAFPTTTFDGTIERIGAETHSEAGDQYFLVRAVFENKDGLARDGMVGRARIRATGGWFQSGWYPIGYVLLRSAFLSTWQKVWGWLP